MAVSFLPSSRNGRLLVYDGYLFRFCRSHTGRQTVGTNTYWKCKNEDCSARVTLHDDVFEKLLRFHNHAPHKKELMKRKFIEQIRDRVRNDPIKNMSKMYREEVEKAPVELSEIIPKYDCIKHIITKARAQTQAKSVEGLGAKSKGAASLNEPKQPKCFLSCRPPVADESVQPTSTEEMAVTPDLRLTSAKETVTASNLQPYNKETVTTPNLLPTSATEVIPDFQTPTTSGVQPVLYPLNSINTEIEVGALSLNSTENICSNQTNTSLLEPQIILKEGIIEMEENIKDAPATYSFKDVPGACSSKENLQENFEATDINQAKDNLDEFGVFVVSKLRNLDWKSCAYVQKAIADILCDAESGHFTLPQEDNFEEMSDSTINGQHEANADTMLLQSEFSCSGDSTYYVSDSESSLVEKSVCPDKINSKFQNLKLCQKGVKRPRQNSPVARLSKDDSPENFDEPITKLPKDHFDAFGVFAVSKLRTLDQKLCAYVQKAISNLLFDAELGLFLTPKEKTGYREKSISIINRLQESNANILSLGV